MKGEGRGKKFSGMMFLKKFFEGRGGDFEEKFFLMMVFEKIFFQPLGLRHHIMRF